MRRLLITLGWIALIVAAVVIRLHGLRDLGLQHWDEGAYTAGPLGIGPYARKAIVPFYAPFLFPSLVGLAFEWFGTSDTVAILCAAIPGILTIVVLGWLATRLFGRTAGMIAALLLATTEYHIAYCRMALTDAPFLFFFLASLALYHRAFERPKSLWSLAAGYVAGLALFTKYHGGLACGTAGLYLLVSAVHGLVRRTPDRRARIERLVWVTLISGFAFAQAMAVLAWFLHRTVGFAAFAENRAQWANGWHLWTVAATARYIVRAFGEWTSPALWLLALVGFLSMVRRPTRGAGYLACAMLLFLASLPAYKNYPRLLLPLVPGLCMLAAVGIVVLARSFSDRWRPFALVSTSVLVAALGVWGARDLLANANSGYRAAGEYLTRHARPDERILAMAQHNLFFYLRDSRSAAYSHNELPDVRDRCDRGEYEWLVTDLRWQHAMKLGYAELIERERSKLELVQTFANELNAFVIVNHGGFELLDRLRSARTSTGDDEEATLVRSIRIYRHVH